MPIHHVMNNCAMFHSNTWIVDSRKERKNRQDLIELFKITKDYLVLEVINCLCWTKTQRYQGHCLKLRKTWFTRDITKHFLKQGGQ